MVRREANRQYRSRLRGALRAIRTAIDSGDSAKVKDALRETISLVDRMAGKKVIHRNAAARYKSRLAKRVSKRTAA
jgi:small subunit ribosomal protein S20